MGTGIGSPLPSRVMGETYFRLSKLLFSSLQNKDKNRLHLIVKTQKVPRTASSTWHRALCVSTIINYYRQSAANTADG